MDVYWRVINKSIELIINSAGFPDENMFTEKVEICRGNVVKYTVKTRKVIEINIYANARSTRYIYKVTVKSSVCSSCSVISPKSLITCKNKKKIRVANIIIIFSLYIRFCSKNNNFVYIYIYSTYYSIKVCPSSKYYHYYSGQRY